MRVLFLADLHGNWEALLALQRAEPQPDAVLFAGDAVGYGPDPGLCLRWLLSAGSAVVAVGGNHDEAVGCGEDAPDGMPEELEDAARETMLYSRVVLSREEQATLARWPASTLVRLGGVRFYMTHGTPDDPLGGEMNPALCSADDLRWLFGNIPADVIVLGHTHVPAIRRWEGRLIVNPGSLGQPRYGLPDATYAVWDDGDVQIKHLHYDCAAVARKLRFAPLSPEVVDQLVGILKTGLLN